MVRALNDRVEELFFQGNYRDILALESGASLSTLSSRAFPYFVGALCFHGRRDAAESLFLRRVQSLDLNSRAACRFFLGMAFCRHGDYSKARSYFAAILASMRKTRDPVALFYGWQGLGFYRYFCARFQHSKEAAEEALVQARLNGFKYGMAIASDLLGHALVQLGSIQAGLSRLDDARGFARSLGDGGLANSIAISKTVYRAQFGLSRRDANKELRIAAKHLDPQNSHAPANLLLETANQFLLRGRLAEAESALNEASQVIYLTRNKPYEGLLSLRFAEISFRSGQFAAALHSVRSVRSHLDPRHDRVLILMALGLELKLLRSLETTATVSVSSRASCARQRDIMRDEIDKITQRLDHLTEGTSREISRVIRDRQLGREASSFSSEDRIAALHFRIRENRGGAVRHILRSGYLSLLSDCLGVEPSRSVLMVGLLGGDLAIFDRGQTFYRAKGVSQQLLKLLSLLARGQMSKEDLIEKLWEYRYHPLRHDPLVHQAISRLRELLGPYYAWIEISETGYRIRPGVEVRLASTLDASIEPAPPISAPRASSVDLNHRQIQILTTMKRERFLRVADCVKRFGVTDMTLRRDFLGLLQQGRIQRVGKARATRYRLPVLNTSDI